MISATPKPHPSRRLYHFYCISTSPRLTQPTPNLYQHWYMHYTLNTKLYSTSPPALTQPTLILYQHWYMHCTLYTVQYLTLCTPCTHLVPAERYFIPTYQPDSMLPLIPPPPPHLVPAERCHISIYGHSLAHIMLSSIPPLLLLHTHKETSAFTLYRIWRGGGFLKKDI